MLVSIIVPIFNSEKYLTTLLKSIAIQTHQNIEIILIDDGSTDSSEVICQKFIGEETRARYIKQHNSGVSSARNKGIEESNGDYIYFVDSDDELFPESVSSLYNTIVENNSNFAVGNYSKMVGEEELLVSHQVVNEPHFYIEEVLAGREHAALWNKLISRSLIGDTRFNPELCYMEDQVFLVDILVKEVQLSYTENLVYKYRLHSLACTSELTEKTLASRVLAAEIIINKLEAELSESILNCYKANCIYFLIINSNKLSDNTFYELKSKLVSLNYPIHKKLIIWLYFKKSYRTLRFIKALKSLM